MEKSFNIHNTIKQNRKEQKYNILYWTISNIFNKPENLKAVQANFASSTKNFSNENYNNNYLITMRK